MHMILLTLRVKSVDIEASYFLKVFICECVLTLAARNGNKL